MAKPRGMSVINRVGHRYGMLTVIGRAPNRGTGKNATAHWVCRCDCTNVVIVRGHSLQKGNDGRGGTRSCGCLTKKIQAERLTTHGMARSRIYRVWHMMRQRCNNPKSGAWETYGGRGIKVCEPWSDFETFVHDMGLPDAHMTLDRINPNGNYCKENCRWATRHEQANNRRTNRYITFNGETKTLAQWAKVTGLTVFCLRARLHRGWPTEQALTEPKIRNPHYLRNSS
jgi:hypothetical protein